METEKHYWRSRIAIVRSDSLDLLQESINEFCKDKFVVGIQYPDAWQTPRKFIAVISYKIQESEADAQPDFSEQD